VCNGALEEKNYPGWATHYRSIPSSEIDVKQNVIKRALNLELDLWDGGSSPK
jgi:hypothetical protein